MPEEPLDAEKAGKKPSGPAPAGWSARVVLSSTGERMVFLLRGRFGLPEPWVARYGIFELRPGGYAWRSMRNTYEGIARGIDFYAARGVDDLAKMVAKRLPPSRDLAALAAHMRLRKAATLDASAPSDPLVRASAHYASFVEYVAWLHEEVCESHPRPEDKAKERLEFRLRASRKQPAGASAGSGKERFGLTAKQRDLFQAIIVPGATGNPFQIMAVRNFVLLDMSFNLGMRSGELLGLRIRDFTLTGAQCRVAIRFNADDPSDPRKRQPGQKTRGRELPLSADMARKVEFLMAERRTLPAARSHPYLFVNQNGQPLGQGGFELVFKTLRKAAPRLADLINHILRHDWNDRWREMVKETGWNLSEAQDRQTRAMGWTPGSSMPTTVYGKRSLRQRADESIIALQERSRRGGAAK